MDGVSSVVSVLDGPPQQPFWDPHVSVEDGLTSLVGTAAQQPLAEVQPFSIGVAAEGGSDPSPVQQPKEVSGPVISVVNLFQMNNLM